MENYIWSYTCASLLQTKSDLCHLSKYWAKLANDTFAIASITVYLTLQGAVADVKTRLFNNSYFRQFVARCEGRTRKGWVAAVNAYTAISKDLK